MSNIELTVGMPLYRTKYIAWMSLESLCRQLSIDFDWELIVVEEIAEKALPFGKDNILSYTERLKKVGCKNIVYVPLNKWIPLSLKYPIIADKMSETSLCVSLQAGDCYSSPGRLKETLRLFKTENADWVHSRIHVIYNIADEKIVLLNKGIHPCGANMAIRSSLFKQLKIKARRIGVDRLLYDQCSSIKGNNFKVVCDITDNWKYSININGLNNLSERCGLFNKMPNKSNIIRPLIPKDILQRLRESKKYLKGWKRI